MCDLANLFWISPAIPNLSKGSGKVEKDDGVKKLMLNRLTPCEIEVEKLSKLSVCKFHSVKFAF